MITYTSLFILGCVSSEYAISSRTIEIIRLLIDFQTHCVVIPQMLFSTVVRCDSIVGGG